MGYVESEFPVYHHSETYEFRGGSGFKNPFIRKDQYDLLVNLFNSDNRISIDEFYVNENNLYSYLFDGSHLFLSAYKNRSTKLDWMSNKLKYHNDYNLLMDVVEKIESLNDGVYQVDILQEGCKILKNCRMIINKTISTLPTYTTKKEAIWLAIIELLNHIN